ncbi:pilus assembly protein TadG-related protein [Mariniblastus fucicola]|uniref:von Willebrand factor type A domain protein n=1 Tax=Mariniblastus fucicola TaxID=980251 RepID=A0A5B9PDZ8_9BACT|nr:pilus assembly protein TadG-related protein [Mariniblastus fucicola]QEG23162.1 von Willebrand factor type A domain protein [Mariniblastus fucicola]
MQKVAYQRRGAIVPLFAIVLPALLVISAIAINLAYVQLSDTEMQIAVDAATHAGGRRLGTPRPNADGSVQTLAETKAEVIDFAAEIAAMNKVAGSPAAISESDMQFGRSTRVLRSNGTMAPYQFQPTVGNQIPSSFRIISNDIELPHAIGAAGMADSFTVKADAVSTQVDRDLVLVLDRSGSMIYFEDEALFEDTLYDLSQETYTVESETTYEYRVQWRRADSSGSWSNSSHGPYMTEAEFAVYPSFPSRNDYRLNYSNQRTRSGGSSETRYKISNSEYQDGKDGVYDRWYTKNVIYWLEVDQNNQHTLGDDPDTWADGLTTDQQREELTTNMALYAHDYRYRYKLNNSSISSSSQINSRQAPAYSRWYHLERGVNVFLNVLGGGVDPDGTVRDGTVQKEQVAILPFNASPDTQNSNKNPDFDYGLQDDGFPAAYVNDSSEPGYDVPYEGSTISIRDVLPTICPYAGTAIGDSMREGAWLIRNMTVDDTDARARAFAAKTIVVLTDGDSNTGDDPVDVAREELAHQDVIVHTITFTPGVSANGKSKMADVAMYGRGKHYHTDSGAGLSKIFEEIANNLPTILTQ